MFFLISFKKFMSLFQVLLFTKKIGCLYIDKEMTVLQQMFALRH